MYTLREKINFIQKTFGTCIISRDGINVAVNCPACSGESDQKKKLSINAKTDQCHCWVCGFKSKSLFPILKKYFPSSVGEYEKKFKSKKIGKYFSETNELAEVDTEIHLPKDFVFLAGSNHRDPDVRDCIRYIKTRGLTDRDMWYFKMGTCKSGRYRRRVIIPSFNKHGRLNYFTARSIDPDVNRKYINARVKSADIVFNEINIDWSKEITLVEGPFDLTKCNDNTTCILGSQFSEKTLIFKEIISNQTPVLLALDADMRDKTQKYAKLLCSYGVEVRVLDLGGFSDVGEMSKSDFLENRNQAIMWKSTDRIYHLIDSINTGTII